VILGGRRKRLVDLRSLLYSSQSVFFRKISGSGALMSYTRKVACGFFLIFIYLFIFSLSHFSLGLDRWCASNTHPWRGNEIKHHALLNLSALRSRWGQSCSPWGAPPSRAWTARGCWDFWDPVRVRCRWLSGEMRQTDFHG